MTLKRDTWFDYIQMENLRGEPLLDIWIKEPQGYILVPWYHEIY